MLGRDSLWVGILALACAQASEPSVSRDAAPRALSVEAATDLDATYLQPNVKDKDGIGGYVHVTPADMPLRVAIGYPRVPARYGSREETRGAAIEAMQMWETAIQPRVPWFRLEFVEKDQDAPVQVVWKSRITGPWGGFGGIAYRIDGARLRVGGKMEVSTTPLGPYGKDARLEVDEVRLLIAHEFGHVLGLMHCLDCDSAMNYAWHTRGRIIVTELDALTFAALVEIPNGTRVDDRPLSFLPEDALPGVDAGDEP